MYQQHRADVVAAVPTVTPAIVAKATQEALLRSLNDSRDVFVFIASMRKAFKDALRNEKTRA